MNIGEGTTEAKMYNPVILNVRVHDNVKTFTYQDLGGETIKQYIHNRWIKAYFKSIDDALKVLNVNIGLVESYQISCDRLVVGVNFIPASTPENEEEI